MPLLREETFLYGLRSSSFLDISTICHGHNCCASHCNLHFHYQIHFYVLIHSPNLRTPCRSQTMVWFLLFLHFIACIPARSLRRQRSLREASVRGRGCQGEEMGRYRYPVNKQQGVFSSPHRIVLLPGTSQSNRLKQTNRLDRAPYWTKPTWIIVV